MFSENRGNNPQLTRPVYVIYPGGFQGNVNHALQVPQDQAAPPKYEDVIGIPTEQMPPAQPPPPPPSATYARPEEAGVILVTPVYKYTKTQRIVGTIFFVVIIVAFVSVFIKILGAQTSFEKS